MPIYKITIRDTRIIPWDIGVPISKQYKRKIEDQLSRSKWRFHQHGLYCKKNNSIAYKFNEYYILTLDIYDDGFAVFTIHEKVKRLKEEHDFDPVISNQGKTNSHISILEGRHAASPLIYQTMKEIWKCVPKKKRRNSASEKWENKGLSYVFSFSIIQTKPNVLRNKSFVQKIHACLFPLPVAEISVDFEMDQTSTIQDHTTSDWQINIAGCTIADFPFRKLYFSWSTAIIAGAINNKIAFEFCKTMRDLQHAWLSAYIADRHLDNIVTNLSNIDKITDLIDLDSNMSRVSREIGKFTSIPDSMATSVTRKTYQVASKQSGLDGLSYSIQSKLQYIRNEISGRIEKRNWVGYRRIEFILAILTFIQAVSAYKSIIISGGLSFNELIALGISLTVLLLLLLLR